MEARRDHKPQTAGLEQALLNALKLGLSGDRASLRQLGRQMLTKPPQGVTMTEDFRLAIGRMLSESAVGLPAPFRSTQVTDLPADAESALALLRIDRAIESEAPALPPNIAAAIDEVLAEHFDAERLLAAGVTPTRMLLLVGAPG